MNFIDFAAAHGLVIDRLIEGRWMRTRTTDKPKTKRNGAYKFLGEVAFVQNHGTMQEVAVWRPDGSTERIDRMQVRRMQAKAASEERERHEAARRLADEMVRRAVVDVHPYLASKGFQDERGLVLDGELLIPMREFKLYKQINSLQRITREGGKKFLFGGKAKGSVYFLGSFMARERWVCEGLATGLSLRAALRSLYRDAQIVVAFSASNLAHVGRMVKPLRPQAFVFADHDVNGVGARAAEEAGLPWGMPPTAGDDANDLHQRDGVRALAELLRKIAAPEVVRERLRAANGS